MRFKHSHLASIVGYMLLSWLLAHIKISFLVGTQTAHFSLAHCLIPLVGLFAGSLGISCFFGLRTLITTSHSLLIACHLPSVAAALYLATFNKNKNTISLSKKLFLSLIPLTCMILFNLHPVGNQAFTYSFFWLIPLATLIIPHTNLFFHMLGSTFTAHAVGSVLWLYAGLIPDPQTWVYLIPVVALERVLFASGMYVGYTIIRKITHFRLASGYNPSSQQNCDGSLEVGGLSR